MSEESQRMLEEVRQQLNVDDGSSIPSDSPPEDYLSAAAVVEAARELETAQREYQAANETVTAAINKKLHAEKKLKKTLENLQRADTGRKGL